MGFMPLRSMELFNSSVPEPEFILGGLSEEQRPFLGGWTVPDPSLSCLSGEEGGHTAGRPL